MESWLCSLSNSELASVTNHVSWGFMVSPLIFFFLIVYFLGAGELVQRVKCLLCMCEDWSFLCSYSRVELETAEALEAYSQLAWHTDNKTAQGRRQGPMPLVVY